VDARLPLRHHCHGWVELDEHGGVAEWARWDGPEHVDKHDDDGERKGETEMAMPIPIPRTTSSREVDSLQLLLLQQLLVSDWCGDCMDTVSLHAALVGVTLRGMVDGEVIGAIVTLTLECVLSLLDDAVCSWVAAAAMFTDIIARLHAVGIRLMNSG